MAWERFLRSNWLLIFVLGGFGLPFGVPPLPEDPMMANIAPEECVAYLSSAGMATPDAKSGNQTEQLLAEPEVRQMAAEIERAVRAGLKKAVRPGSLPPGVTSDDLADAVKLLLTRPLAVYVSSVQMQPGGPVVRGGIVVNCGDEAAKLKAIVEQLAKDRAAAACQGNRGRRREVEEFQDEPRRGARCAVSTASISLPRSAKARSRPC